jgi:hypothetical protein
LVGFELKGEVMAIRIVFEVFDAGLGLEAEFL